jgi:DNA-binding Lrp family transcriptional regulator
MDERDRVIISRLQANGKETLSNIAKIIGLSEMGVKKRIDKLKEKGIIRIQAVLNVKALDLKLALIAMELESSDALKKLIKRFENCPRVIRFFVSTGGYNLFALVYAEDYHTLESMSIEKCSLRSQEGVRRFEIYPIQDIYYDDYLDLKIIPEKVLENAPCGVHCGSCDRYSKGLCLGCPATKYYRGEL